jgi:hypothetical protein
MGLLKRLLNPPTKTYVEEGCRLTGKLVRLFNLTDWPTGVPSYTAAEERAMEYGLQELRRSAGENYEKVQPDAVPTLERIFVSDALQRLAGDSFPRWEDRDDDKCPQDWKAKVSTYLKAWAMRLDPDVLLDLAGLLKLAGFKGEAKAAASIVADWFPRYAPLYYGESADTSVVEHFTARAREMMAQL